MSTFKRVVVIAPTRSTCVNLHHLLQQEDLPETLLTREHGAELEQAIAELPQGGFGIVAGTGTGKSAAIRMICSRVLPDAMKVGIVTLEHKASKGYHRNNVVVVTPGVAMQWAKAGMLTSDDDLIVLDEVHQTSEHLELSMALLKRTGATFVWMSATIDPSAYREYLSARRVIISDAYDPQRRAVVQYHRGGSAQQYMKDNLSRISVEQRGVALFVPTRADAESIAKQFDGTSKASVNFYHGGEPAEKLRAFMDGSIEAPFVIVMTSAGASSLNIAGLDTVVIVDRQFKTVVSGGRSRLVNVPLDANTMLQMAGRVDGRALNGEVHIITDRYEFDLRKLNPETPAFMLGASHELLALTTALAEIDVLELELIGGLDEAAYNRTFNRLVQRGLVAVDPTDGRPSLTTLGAKIEPLPVPAAWGEIIIAAQKGGDTVLLMAVCLAACVGELYKLTGRSWSRYDDMSVVSGSDSLTGANIVCTALRLYGKLRDGAYRLNSKDQSFVQWCKRSVYSPKEIASVALLFGSLLERLGLDLPEPEQLVTIAESGSLHQGFVELLAKVQSLDYVQSERHNGVVVFGNSKHGVSSGYSTLGAIRYWNDSNGIARASIEGTDIPRPLVRTYAERHVVGVEVDWDGRLVQLTELYFAGQLVEVVRDYISDDQLTPEQRAEKAWHSWTDRPEIAMPDLSAESVAIPPVVEAEYYCDHSGTTFVAYGCLAVNSQRYWQNDPWFVSCWTRDRDEAASLCSEAVGYLESVLGIQHAELRLEAAKQQAAPLRARLLELWGTFSYAPLPSELKDRLRKAAYRYPHDASSLEDMQEWGHEAEAIIAEVVAETERLEAERVAHKAELLEAVKPLRDKVNEILVSDESDHLSTEMYDDLCEYDIGNDQFPMSISGLEDWIREVKRHIAKAEAAIKLAALTADDLTPDHMAALAARFNSR